MTQSREFSRASVRAGIAATVGMLVSVSTLNNSFGLFLKPLSAEFDWSRTEISAIHTVYAWSMALLLPFSGRLMDRFGVKPVVVPGLVLLTVCFAALSALNGSLWGLYAVFFIMAFCGATSGPVPYSKVITGWFHSRRGLVLALIAVGAGIGGGAVPPLAGILIETFGWRVAFLAFGALVLLVGLPLIGLLLCEAPTVVAARELRAKGHQADVGVLGVSAAEARMSRPFLLCVVATATVILVNASAMLHVPALLSDRGETAGKAAVVMTAMAVGGTICRLVEGWVLDRVQTPRLAVPFVLLMLAGLLALHHGTGLPTYIVAGFLLGAGVTAEVSLMPYFITRYFGLLAFGEIYGALFACGAIAAGLGPLVTGFVFDQTGSYSGSLWVAEGAMLVVIACLIGLPAYRFPARLPDLAADPDDPRDVAADPPGVVRA